MATLKVCLDPGHCENYNLGVVDGFYEGNMTLALAQALKRALEGYGAEVVLTRATGSENPTLTARGKTAIAQGCQLFISLHSDAAASADVRGVTVIRSLLRPNSAFLGAQLAQAIGAAMDTPLRYGKGVWTREATDLVGKDYYTVLYTATQSEQVQDAFLIEHGFHTNRADCTFLDSSAKRAKLAEEEARVIAAYYGLAKLKTPEDVTAPEVDVQPEPTEPETPEPNTGAQAHAPSEKAPTVSDTVSALDEAQQPEDAGEAERKPNFEAARVRLCEALEALAVLLRE